MKKALKIGIMGMIGFMLFVYLGYIIPSPDLNVSIVVARANGKSLSQLEIVDSLMKRRFNYESR